MRALRIAVGLASFALIGAFGRLHAQADGSQRWAFATGGYVASSPAVAADGTIYVGVRIDSTPNRGRLLAIRRDGTLSWQFPKPTDPQIDWVESSPAIAADGTVYFGSWNGRLYAINPDGTKKWEFDARAFAIFSSPTLASDGTVYVISGDLVLHAVTKDGVERWNHRAGSLYESAPAIGGDGTLYFGADDQNVYALNPDGSEKWRASAGAAIVSSAAIGPDGTIYLGASDHHLLAFAPDGTPKWKFPTGDLVVSSPSVAADGTIYFGSLDQQFYALNPDGTQKWKANVRAAIASTAAVRADGTVIFGADDNLVHALNPDGTAKWTFPTLDLVESSPAVAADGSIYVGSFDGRLYSLNGTGAPPSGFSSWPMFNHDAAHAGRARPLAVGAYLVNLSTYAPAGGGANLIAGFVVQGTGAKNFLIRAVGPTLAQFNVPNVLADPAVSLVFAQSGTGIASNDNWSSSNENFFAVLDATFNVGTFPLPVGGNDAALARLLSPDGYTAVVTSSDGGSGVALVEVYDANVGSAAARLINLSTRALARGGEGILTAGLVVGGKGALRVLMRAIGPGLAQFGVGGALARPTMRVYAGQTVIGGNTGWTSGNLTEDLAAAARLTGAFPLQLGSADSATVMTLAPGNYTIQVAGADGGTGDALVEVYVVP